MAFDIADDAFFRQAYDRPCGNFLILWRGTAVFWSTVPAVFGKAAAVTSEITKEVSANIEKELSVIVISIVADNENSPSSLPSFADLSSK